VLAPECTISGTKLSKEPFYSIGTKMTVGSVSEHFANLCHVIRCKTCVRAWMHYSGTKGTEHPFYSIGTKMMFGSVSEHFTNLRHVKICRTCVSSLNALFRGTKVLKHPFYSIRTKMMFGSVLEHFSNLRHVSRCKTCVRAECTVSVYRSCEASILLHWNENDVWECFRAFCWPSACKKM
jgi:hypothetical protein